MIIILILHFSNSYGKYYLHIINKIIWNFKIYAHYKQIMF